MSERELTPEMRAELHEKGFTDFDIDHSMSDPGSVWKHFYPENQEQDSALNRDRLIAHLGRGGKWQYIWTMPGRESTWFPSGKLSSEPPGEKNVYYGVHPVDEIPKTNAKGAPASPRHVRSQIKDISGINCLFAEHDMKDGVTLDLIEKLDPLPSVVIESGGGWHCYWLLTEPFIIDSDQARERAQELQYRWVGYAGSDAGAKDLARVLRVPGTLNHKYDPPRPVRFVWANFERLYSLDELQACIPEPAPSKNGNGRVKQADPIPDKLPKGKRNTSLTSLAGSMRRRGVSEDVILAALRAQNDSCNPPLPDKDLERIARSVSSYPPAEKRRTRATSAVYIQVLNEHGYFFRMSELDDRVQVNGEPISDAVAAKIRALIRDLHATSEEYLFEVKAAEDAYTADALENAYHPIKNWIDNLNWDGQDHIGKLTSHFKDRYGVFPRYLRRWLVGAMERLYKNGEQNRMLVLDGPQNIGKSYFVRYLAGSLLDFYLESRIDPESKDHQLRLIDKFIWEVPELGSTTRKADRESLKNFISQQWVDARAPYAHHALHKPALANFIATVNNENGFLNDPTGTRRFMVSTLEEINWDYSKDVDVNQVWAHARALFDAGETGKLQGDEYTEAELLNDEYKTISSIHERLDEIILFEPDGFVLTNDIIDELKARGHGGSENWMVQEVANWMKPRGIEQVRRRLNISGSKKQLRGYVGIKIAKRSYIGGQLLTETFSRTVTG